MEHVTVPYHVVNSLDVEMASTKSIQFSTNFLKFMPYYFRMGMGSVMMSSVVRTMDADSYSGSRLNRANTRTGCGRRGIPWDFYLMWTNRKLYFI